MYLPVSLPQCHTQIKPERVVNVSFGQELGYQRYTVGAFNVHIGAGTQNGHWETMVVHREEGELVWVCLSDAERRYPVAEEVTRGYRAATCFLLVAHDSEQAAETAVPLPVFGPVYDPVEAAAIKGAAKRVKTLQRKAAAQEAAALKAAVVQSLLQQEWHRFRFAPEDVLDAGLSDLTIPGYGMCRRRGGGTIFPPRTPPLTHAPPTLSPSAAPQTAAPHSLPHALSSRGAVPERLGVRGFSRARHQVPHQACL
jgi:hypothetical protein